MPRQLWTPARSQLVAQFASRRETIAQIAPSLKWCVDAMPSTKGK
jgi:hypothetical protein